MKVILLKDVAKIGRKHTVVEVPAGFGQNQLIPKGLAKPATPQNLKAFKRIQAEKGAQENAALDNFFKAQKALKETTLVLKERKNDNGHLFAAIKPEEIVTAGGEQGILLDKEMIKITEPIKSVGEHRVLLVTGQQQAEFVIKVE